MTTKQDDKSNTKNSSKSSSILPPLYKIEYPNSRTGMFSLRAPFKNFNINERQQQQQIYTRSLTPNIVHPKYLHVDQITQQEQPFFQESLKRDAQVQCSLIVPDSRDGRFIQRPHRFVTDPYDYDDLSPHYRVQLKLQPTQPNIYEAWDIETPPPRSIPINKPIKRREPSIRVRSPRLVNIKSLSDDESDYDDHIVYTSYPQRTYLPGNVRMVYVRQDANTICY